MQANGATSQTGVQGLGPFADPLSAWGGLMSALALLLVAACNFSLLGLLFLVFFLVWAMYCLPGLHSQRGLAINRAYWGTVAGLSTIALLVQCGVQLAFIAQTPGIRRPFITRILRLVGYARIDSYGGFITHFMSMVVASTVTVYAATKAVRRRPQPEPLHRTLTAPAPGEMDVTAINTSAVTFLAMLGVVFARPALISLPYLMSLLIRASTFYPNAAISSEISMHARLQGYAAIHLVTLYGWQWVPIPSSWLLLGGQYVGLFVLRTDGEEGWLNLLEGMTVLGWLGVMVVVQGWDLYFFRTLQPLGGLDLVARVLHVDDQEGTHPPPTAAVVDEEPSRGGGTEDSDASQLTEPLLPPHLPPTHLPPETPITLFSSQPNYCWSSSTAFISALNTWRSVCSHTNLVACAVCALSLLRPSVTGFILLLLGISMTLRSKSGTLSNVWTVVVARVTAFVVAVWTLTSYVATVWKGTDLEASPTCEAWGIHSFNDGIPLALMFATLASLGSNASKAQGINKSINNNTPDSMDPCPSSGLHPSTSLMLGSFRTLCTASLLVTLFLLGTSQYSWVHGIFLATVFLWLVHLTLWSFRPTAKFLTGGSPFGNSVFVGFTFLTIICMYFIYVTSLDAFTGILDWMEEWPHVVAVLQISGLWDPKGKDMALALAVVFLSLGNKEADNGGEDSLGLHALEAPIVMGVHTWRPWWLVSIAWSVYRSGMAMVIGAALPSYILLLYDCDVAFLGLAYLAMFFLLLMSGPLPASARWRTDSIVEEGEEGEGMASNDVELAPPRYPTSSALIPDMLRSLVAIGRVETYEAGSETRLWLDSRTIAPWVALHALCCLATLDFTLQALFPALGACQYWPHFPPWIPSKSAVLRFMSCIVGINPDAYGADLALRLARPACLLAATAMIKYFYAVGVAHDQIRRFDLIDARQECDEHVVESELDVKENTGLFSGFLPRLGILHSSKLAIIIILAAAMDVPSALGMLFIVGSTVGAALLGPPRARSGAGRRAMSFLLFSAGIVAALWTCARYAVQIPIILQYVRSMDGMHLLAWFSWLGVYDAESDRVEKSLRPMMSIAASIAFKYITIQWLEGLPTCIRDDPESITIASYGSACPSWLGPRMMAYAASLRSSQESKSNSILNTLVYYLDTILYRTLGFRLSIEKANDNVDENENGSKNDGLWQAAREWTERWFADWGMDLVLLTLLIAAFMSANVYSLLYFSAVVLGMTYQQRTGTVLWSWTILPLIAVSWVWLYCVTAVGPPPSLPPHWSLIALPRFGPDVDAWLGLTGEMNIPALLAIGLAYFLAVGRFHVRSLGIMPPLGYSADALEGRVNNRCNVWAPLTREAMPSWRLHDRIRYAVYRRSLEALLIAVVLVCVMENDIIHAGYLAIALFFFRSRLTLRNRRNSAFAILPGYNMAVMAIALAYQAPLSIPSTLCSSSAGDCTLGHLLGLYKLNQDCDEDRGTCTPLIFTSYGYRTAAVDLLLWILIRLQMHVFGSRAFVKAALVMEAQEEEERECRWEMEQRWMDDQANAALLESKHREARNARILRMKRDGGGWFEVFKAGQDGSSMQNGDGLAGLHFDGESEFESGTMSENEDENERRREMEIECVSESKSKSKSKSKSETMLPLTEYEQHLAEASTPNLAQAETSNVAEERPWSAVPWIGARITMGRASAPPSRESVPAYVLFVIAYLSDLSLFGLLLPLSAFTYSLVSVRPSRMYWHVVLIYCELLIVASFAFRVPARLGCDWAADPDVVRKAKLWGLHSDAFLSIPLFLVYLVTLHHVQGLVVRHAAGQRLAAAALDTARDREEEEGSERVRYQPAVPWLSKALAAMHEFVMQACTPSERPPSFLLVDMETERPEPETHDVQSRLQQILDRSTETKSLGSFIDIYFHSQCPISEAKEDEHRCSRRYLFQVVAHQRHKCVKPATAAAAILSMGLGGNGHDDSSAQEQEQKQQSTLFPSSWKLLRVEAHSRSAHDYYAATATLDLLALLYVAFFYNQVVSAAGSISEITSQHAVPIGFLLTLMTLFGFVVLDRVAYTLGSAAGKFALHMVEMALLLSYCSFLAWSPSRGAPQSWLLSGFLAIKSASFALSALQIRSGYPPPASYVNGMGRHTFVFMRSLSVPSSAAFHVFTAIPFLYEMRQLLDWACTPTTLTLYDWLKLEDVNIGLYFAAVMRKAKSGRPLGAPQPRCLKFFQGTLLFSALLILIWVPLLVFSTGNPTYQPPAVTAFSINATLHLNTTDGLIKSPLYTASDSGTWKLWAGSNTTLPRPLAPDYSVDQVVTLCARPDADSLWTASPPFRRRITGSKLHEQHAGAIEFGLVVVRDLPPPSERGSGPLCVGSVAVPLTKRCLDEVTGLFGSSAQENKAYKGRECQQPFNDNVVPLVRQVNESFTTIALFPAFWLLRGDSCDSRPLRSEDLASSDAFLVPGFRFDGHSGGESAKKEYLSWANRWVACNVSLDENGGTGGSDWWRFDCGLVDATGQHRMEDVDKADGRAGCPQGDAGPSVTVVLDRVQGGIIGATLNKYGVLGLYSVFVYGISRFFRLGITNLRMRIHYEDLPTTRRLVALCQDIYIARAEGLLELEEELYGVLLAVYRLPSVMYSLTKKKVQ